jgi:hypothetical protein
VSSQCGLATGFILNSGEISRDTICEVVNLVFFRDSQHSNSTGTNLSGHIRGNGDVLLHRGLIL